MLIIHGPLTLSALTATPWDGLDAYRTYMKGSRLAYLAFDQGSNLNPGFLD